MAKKPANIILSRKDDALIIDICIIRIVLAKGAALPKREFLQKLFKKMVRFCKLKTEGPYVEAPPVKALPRGSEPGYSYKGAQIFTGGFLELGVLEDEKSLFFNFSSLGDLNYDLLEKAAKSIEKNLPGSKKFIQNLSTRYQRITL
jgi:hypothetical protein